MKLVETEGGSVFPVEMLESAREASAVLKALSHENRLLILCSLADGEKTVIELEKALGIRQPAVSQQLARLRGDKLVDTRRDGKAVYYTISDDKIRHIIKLLYSLYCAPKLNSVR